MGQFKGYIFAVLGHFYFLLRLGGCGSQGLYSRSKGKLKSKEFLEKETSKEIETSKEKKIRVMRRFPTFMRVCLGVPKFALVRGLAKGSVTRPQLGPFLICSAGH